MKKKKIKIALAQIKIEQKNIEENCKKIFEKIEEAAKENVDIICFPELATIGYTITVDELQNLPEDFNNTFIEELQEKAKLFKIHILVGYLESKTTKKSRDFYNSCIFIDDEGKILSRRIRENINKIKKLNLQIENIEEEKTRIAEKKDILEFQLNEINSLELKENEDNELEEEYKILFNAGKINEKLEETSQFLKEGEFSILTALGRAKRNLEQLSDLSESYNELYEKIESVLYEVEEISYSVDNFAGDVEIDDKKLEKIVERIDNINKLKLKYGSTIAEILEYRDKIEKEKESIIKTLNREKVSSKDTTKETARNNRKNPKEIDL